MNKGVVNGLLFGVVTVLVGLVLYFINKAWFLDPTMRFIFSLVFPITFMTKAGLEMRKKNGGFATFSEVLQPVYLTLVIGSLIFALFQYTMMSSDPELLEIQKEISVESLEKLAGLANLSEESVAEMRQVEADDFKPTIKSLMMIVSKNFILGFIIAVIIALIIKRSHGPSK